MSLRDSDKEISYGTRSGEFSTTVNEDNASKLD